MTLRYFIPDWDDRVDPGFDFEADEHTADRNPYQHDHYAHELYETPPYDGILLSRATLDGDRRKREAIIAAGSVHRYLRLPADGEHKVLGDCGAFSYWQDHVPPYSAEDVIEYYQQLGFDLGVSVDHLIFAELEAEKERRWQITIDNAEEFLRLRKTIRYTFTPVGVAQGWNPDSYRRAAKALVDMGYDYIAIGGLVRSSTNDILRTLAAVQEVLRPGMQVHLFGVSRTELARTIAGLGVTSFDSASRLRRAWMDGRRNYFLGDDAFTAIRIPDAQTVARKRNADESEAQQLERNALDTLRAYHREQATLDEAYAAVAAYAYFCADQPRRVEESYRRTLAARPWQQCPCAICRAIGVEVIIFRGNNRNRRRGFHNTWQLYQHLQDMATQPNVPYLPTQLEFTL